jgi:hypothetical protein
MVSVNSNWLGTERKEVEGVVVKKGSTSSLVRIRDEVAEYLRSHRAVITGVVSITELSTPLYRVIKRKHGRDFPADASRDGDATSSSEVQ